MLRHLQTFATLQRFPRASLGFSAATFSRLSRVFTEFTLLADLWVALTSVYLWCGSMSAHKPSGHFCQFKRLSTPLRKTFKTSVRTLTSLQLSGSSELKQNQKSLKINRNYIRYLKCSLLTVSKNCSHFSSLCQLLHHGSTFKLLTSAVNMVPDFSRKQRWVITACQPSCWTDRRKARNTKELFEAQIFLIFWFSVSFPSITPSSYDPLKPI